MSPQNAFSFRLFPLETIWNSIGKYLEVVGILFPSSSFRSEREKESTYIKKRKSRTAQVSNLVPVDKSHLLGNMSGCGGLR